MMSLSELISRIRSVENKPLQTEIQAHLDDLTKPPGSLGRLEDIAMQYCLIIEKVFPKMPVGKLFTFAGDHGITDENLTPYPKAVTMQMVLNMLTKGSAASVMCRTAGIKHIVVDMGVDADLSCAEGLVCRKINRGTKNFCKGAAMTMSECEKAINAGAELVAKSGAGLIGIGEMGIGNSSSASALYSMLLGIDPAKTVGAGTGSTGDLLARKIEAVSRGVALNRQNWDGSAIEALCRVGGFEICGMAGAILGCAVKRIPVVVDGFISGAAGLTASRICPDASGYIFYSHASAESFHREFLKLENLKPILELDMRLGEGTGAVLAMQIIEQAVACYSQMATFSSAGVSEKN
jgi:nicotinate-nucleotide--dimethylbenzimidazole phosphoribosyltransferase